MITVTRCINPLGAGVVKEMLAQLPGSNDYSDTCWLSLRRTELMSAKGQKPTLIQPTQMSASVATSKHCHVGGTHTDGRYIPAGKPLRLITFIASSDPQPDCRNLGLLRRDFGGGALEAFRCLPA